MSVQNVARSSTSASGTVLPMRVIGRDRRRGRGTLVVGSRLHSQAICDQVFPEHRGSAGHAVQLMAWLLKNDDGRPLTPGQRFEFPLDFDTLHLVP